MNQAVNEYKRQLKQHLSCGNRRRKELMEQFQETLNNFLEENPSPDFSALEEAFGTPEHMAKELMETVPPHEIDQWKQRRNIRRVVVGVLACVFVVVLGYFAFLRARPVEVTVQKTITIYASEDESNPGITGDETDNTVEALKDDVKAEENQ
jgi:uncharacterized membrane protein